MAKHAISITLSEANLTWLKGRAAAAGYRSVSDLVDNIVADVRTGGGAAAVRSVVGTIDLAEDDPDLATADASIDGLFRASISRPIMAREHAGNSAIARKAPRTRKRG
jgi:hypothetical protein